MGWIRKPVGCMQHVARGFDVVTNDECAEDDPIGHKNIDPQQLV